jgi:serine/alanine adding enzyme
LELLTDQDVSLDKWRIFLSKSQFYTPFHTPEFYDLFNSIPNYSAKIFVIEEHSQIIALCIVTLQGSTGLKNIFTKRAIIYGGPVLEKQGNDCIKYLLDSISAEYKSKSIYLELRCLSDFNTFKNTFKIYQWDYIPYQNYIVDCSNSEKLFQKLGNNRKRQIKKALKSGVTIKEADSINEIHKFYSILHHLYSKRIKKPLFPMIFFEEFFNKKLGIYLLVIYRGEIIGGIMCPFLRERAIYEFYICGLDEDYKEQYPSVMATWGAMDYGSKNQIPVFDFMGAGRKDMDYGVRDFKARFGGELIEYGRYIKINKPLLYSLGKLVLKILKVIKF